jgi:hypothetical protein
MSEESNGGAPQKTQITISGVRADLNNGLSRPQIQTKYNLTGKDLKDLFAHPKLKGLKTKVGPSFTLIDDVEDEVAAETTQEVSDEEASNMSMEENSLEVNSENVQIQEEF